MVELPNSFLRIHQRTKTLLIEILSKNFELHGVRVYSKLGSGIHHLCKLFSMKDFQRKKKLNQIELFVNITNRYQKLKY